MNNGRSRLSDGPRHRGNAQYSDLVRHDVSRRSCGDTLRNIESLQFGTQHYDLKKNGLTFETDFAFVIDTTGSMGSSIDSVKSEANTLINALFNDGKTDARVGVVGFKDTTNGEPSSVILTFTDQDSFAARKSAALAAINSISVSGGGDIPETDDDGLFHALNGDMGEWRFGAGIHRIVLFTDAPVKDVGLRSQVDALAHGIGATVSSHLSALGEGGSIDTFTLASLDDGPSATNLDPTGEGVPPPSTTLFDDPVTPDTRTTTLQIFTIFTGPEGTDTSGLSDIANRTGGSFLTASTGDDLVNELLAIIKLPPPASQYR